MSAIRLVTFDVTNTIIRVLGGVGHNYAKAASLYGVTIEPEAIDSVFPSVFKDMTKKYPNFGVSNGLTPHIWWDQVVKESFVKCGQDDNVDKISQHLYKHFSTKHGWDIFPDATVTLDLLKKRGLKIGVISNFDERLEQILSQLTLRHYFDFVVPSAVVKIAKPDEGIFRLALKMADVKPEEALHIGDNIVNDYNGAKNVGMHAVLIRKHTDVLPENVDRKFVVSKLSDLPEILDNL